VEADWEFEVGGDAPVIDACWPGFIDLRLNPDHALDLEEAAALPGLAKALGCLNGAASPVWTVKCDVWRITDRAEFDADELDAPSESTTYAMGCYIDILPGGDQQWITPHAASAVCIRFCDLLRAVPLRCCRADLIVRRALLQTDESDVAALGATAYFTACGPTEKSAEGALEAALSAFASALVPQPTLQ
jgi:hypothetical protein